MSKRNIVYIDLCKSQIKHKSEIKIKNKSNSIH